ncbi:MAG: PAS domain S-box protein [Deltaproteobacteria bacterium]|nr:PAS domain S-box protein [Deltaproteobacteria bacterium]
MAKNTESENGNRRLLRALVVDDSEDDVLLIMRTLRKGGYKIQFERVETAQTMKKALREKQWDIILCDYKMPDFSAPSAISLLKKEAKINIPIIIISGAIGEETAIDCMRMGAHDYIMKTNLSRLCPAIARELEEVKIREQQKQSEEKLQQSEEQYRNILANIEEGYFEVDLAGNFTFLNDTVCQVMGYSRKELLGMNNRQYTDEKDLKEIFKVYNKIYTTGQPVKELCWQLINKDGAKRYIAGSISLKKDAEGKPIGFRGIARDTTERKQMEEKIREEEQRFRALTEQSSDIILLVNRQGTIIYENKAVDEILGYKQEERIGASSFDNIHPDDLTANVNEFKKLFKDVKAPVLRTEVRLQHKDGSWRTFEEMASGLSRDNRVESVIINLRDITERKKAEGALKDSEAKYRNIFENAMEGIYQATNEGRFITVNNAFARMAGYDSPEELIELINDIEKQLYVNPEDRKRFLEIRKAKGFVDNFEVEFYRKDGSTFWVVINARAVKDETGKILYTEGLIEDITLRKSTEEKLQQSLERLKKAVNTTIQVLVSALEVRDPYTAGHQSRSANLACAIAGEMGLVEEKMEGIRMAGIIHDIGKLSIPVEILSKPTKLTDLEFSLIKEHSRSGFEMLKNVDSPWPLSEIVYQHHERVNGTGYPRNLKGDEILVEARILAVADVVEAMASHRPYRASLGIEAALEEIEKNKGILYDETVANACLRLFHGKGYIL